MVSETPITAPNAATSDDGFARWLETDGLVVLPGQPFTLTAAEGALLDPASGDGRAKNISLGAAGGVRGAADDPQVRSRLEALMTRYRHWARGALLRHAPRYAEGLETGRTSLRTREVAEGAASPRQDDRRLHVDAFSSQPTAGRRILRVFTNVNPHGESRLWKVGEAFEPHARRFLDKARPPLPGEAALLRALGVTRARRTPYDHYMLQLHDRAKLDPDYQATAPARDLAFPPGASWIVYTDSVVHAAVGGRFALEQTFYLPPAAMAAPHASPVCILERLTGRTLIAQA
jgi:hypothetical protein